MNVAFHSAPLDAWLWLPILGIGLAAFFLVEIDKALRQGVRRRREAAHASEPA